MRPALLLAALAALAPVALAQQNRFEPNQTRRTASPLQPGDYKGLLCNDEDWFAVEVPAGQRIEVDVRFDHARGDLELDVTDGRGKLIGWSHGTADDEAAAVTPKAGGTVYVRVHNATAPYDLHVGLASSGMAVEGEGLSGKATCWGADWYPVEVPAGRSLVVDLGFVHASGDLDVALVTDQGAELASASGKEDGERLRWTATQATTALLQVKHIERGKAEYTLRLALGVAVAADLGRAFRVERPEGKGQDVVELRGGDTLRGTVLDESYRISTPYAELVVPAARVAGVDLERRGSDMESILTVDEEQLSGFVRAEVVRMKVNGIDEPVSIPHERVLRVVFGQRGEERRAPAEGELLVQLACGDVLRARVASTAGWVLDLGFARLPVDLKQLESLAFEPGGVVNLVRSDRTVARGRFLTETIELEVGLQTPPTRLRLHPERLAMVQRTGGAMGKLGPAELRQLLRQLGVTSPPRELLRDMDQEGGVTAERIDQLKPLVPIADGGAMVLERHVVTLEDRAVQYAWFEVLLRVDKRLRDRLVRLVGAANDDRRLRMAAAGALIELNRGGCSQPIEAASASSDAADVLFGVAMAMNDDQTVQRMVQVMRGNFRGGGNREAPQQKDKDALMEQLPRLLSER